MGKVMTSAENLGVASELLCSEEGAIQIGVICTWDCGSLQVCQL